MFEKERELKMLMNKYKVIPVIILVVVFLFVGSSFLIKNRGYSATDVFENIDFNAENPTVKIESIVLRPQTQFTPLEIPEETQQELIKAIKNAKFKKVKSSSINFRYNYRIEIILNAGYAMFADSSKKYVVLDATGETYTVENDNNFFSILENATK